MKAICGTTSLRFTVLALFYESVERGTKTTGILRKSKKNNNNNNLGKQSKATNTSKIEAICAHNVWNFIFMLEFSIFIEEQ